MRSAVKRAQAQGGRSGVIYALLTMISPALEYVYKKVLAAGWTGITFFEHGQPCVLWPLTNIAVSIRYLFDKTCKYCISE